MAKKSPTRSAKKKAPAKKAAAKKATRKVAPKKSATPKKSPVKKAVKKTAPPTKTISKKTVKKAPVKKKAVTKKAPAKKKAASKKPAVKKAAPIKSVKKAPAKKTPAKKKAAVKTTAAKKTAAPETPAPKAVARKTGSVKAPAKKAALKGGLKGRLLGKAKSAKTASVGFSLDEVKEIAKQSKKTEKEVAKKKADNAKEKAAAIEAQIAAAKPTKVAPASLADILGFNPAGGAKANYEDPKAVPAKYRKFYKILLELRTHLTGQIDQHAEDTLKRSAKDDAGDLSSYGQHMADAGTDTFDRDFALSMVASEQEALSEIEAAIQRIKKGTFGLDEATGEPIDKDRLAAVPFTRYSAKTQKELERNRHRVRTQAGLGGEMGDNAGSMTDPNADE